MEITPNINKWLATGERGVSSESIVSHLTGVNIVDHMYGKMPPSDPSDLRRCELLLKAAPELRAELHRMGEISSVWKRLVAEWDDLWALCQREAKENNGNCPLTFKRMKDIGC